MEFAILKKSSQRHHPDCKLRLMEIEASSYDFEKATKISKILSIRNTHGDFIKKCYCQLIVRCIFICTALHLQVSLQVLFIWIFPK